MRCGFAIAVIFCKTSLHFCKQETIQVTLIQVKNCSVEAKVAKKKHSKSRLLKKTAQAIYTTLLRYTTWASIDIINWASIDTL